jgi:DNA-binding MarR family transcriptional regulator
MPIPIPDWFGARRRARIGKASSYNVTALGKTKAEKFDLEGPRWTVLAYLAESGPASVSEIVKESNLNDEKVKLILKGLIKDGYVAPVAGE